MDQENLSKLLKDHPQLRMCCMLQSINVTLTFFSADVLPGNHQVKSLLTIIRDRETSREDFVCPA